ncbi:MAG: homoserine O-acetyltransferase [Verrucomicrobia bacterium]|nr:homoserine O-acetyltransferase [Verrucomicrobiota bacterium]
METVQTQFLPLTQPGQPFRLFRGGSLSDARLAYETYGKLNAHKSNAILVFHALSASQHAAGFNPAVDSVGSRWTDECQTGWWDGFIGPGRAIDTKRFFVICANWLGGCYGSTGPSSVNPVTSKPYGSAFPRLALADQVNAQVQLLDALGIDQLHAAVGASLGGILTLTLAMRFPERVRIVLPVATGARVTPLQRIHNFEQIYAIESDPDFNRGDYDPARPPNRGLAIARMIGHKTYVSLSAMQERARDEIVTHSDDLSWYPLSSTLESYMLHQAQKFVRRFDANTYLRILDAWQRLDLAAEAGCESIEEAFMKCRNHKFLVFSIDSDVCYYPEEQAEIMEYLKKAGADATRITVHTEKGHDSFLLEPALFRPYFRALLMDNL